MSTKNFIIGYDAFMSTLQRTQQTKQNVIKFLKDNSKETISVRLSTECLKEIAKELEGVKRSNPDMAKLSLPKYIAALVEHYANNIRSGK